jgi:predicted transglutaminase-like cysteine proteinase
MPVFRALDAFIPGKRECASPLWCAGDAPEMSVVVAFFRLQERPPAADTPWVYLADAHRPSIPVPPAARPVWPIRGWLRRLALHLLALLVLVAASVHAWDPQRIVAAARHRSPAALAGALALEQAMNGVAGRDEATQLKAVNDFFNRRVAYKEDIDNWGQVDYWASPLETLERGAADCEDYAIAKYFTLVALGMPDAKLRMVYVRATIAGAPNGYVPHMVLAYYPQADAEPLVLDSLQPEIRIAGARPDLGPVFSFNAEGLWQGVGSIRANGDPLTRLSRWREVLQKARQEGFQ